MVKIWTNLLFVVFVAFVPRMQGTQPPRDSVAREKLAKLSEGQPRPLWQAGLKAPETDFIRFLSNDRILVGTLKTAGFRWAFGGLEPGEVVLLNAANGERIWSAPRVAFGYPQLLLATDPVILIQGETKCGALNPENGAVLWERPWKRTRLGGGMLLAPGGERLVLFSEQKTSVLLTAVNVKDGSVAWSAALENYPREKEMVIETQVAGDTLLLVGPEVAAFSAGSGRELWRRPFPGTFGEAATATALGDDLYFTDGPSLTRVEPRSGSVIWRHDFSGSAVENLSIDGASVFVVLREGAGEGSPDSVQALDRDAGKPLWKCDLAGQAQSPMTIEDGRIYMTTADRLLGIDAAKGGPVYKGSIPPNLRTPRALPDILRVSEDRVIVARETGVLALSRQDGSPLYAEPVYETAPFTSDYAMHKLNLATESLTPLKKREQSKTLDLASYSQARRRAELSYQKALFQTRQLVLQSRTRPSFRAEAEKSLTPAETPGQAAINNMVMSNAAMMDAVQGVYDVLAEVSALKATFENGCMVARTGIMTAEISQTFQSHTNSLQKHLYIRPRYEVGKGWSLVLVELTAGKRAEILLSPDNDPLGLSDPNLPAFDVDPSGSRIVSKGLGLDPGRFETYETVAFTPRRGGMLSRYQEKWSIPYPSVLAFDLAALPFGQESDNRRPAPGSAAAEKKQLNDQLIDAAFQCDLAAVKKMLDAGADVNAVNDYGQTALMLAVESLRTYNKDDVIAMLVKRGADISIRDPYGWTAGDHFAVMLTIFPPTSGGAVEGLKLLVK